MSSSSDPPPPPHTSTDTNTQQQQQLMGQVKELLEFYFGNANMSRDRFLKQKMDADPLGFVDISVLCTFNKLKELTTDVNFIAEAAKQSTLLKVDETKTRITRSTPVPTHTNNDSKTVYAELYPQDSNHDSLKILFSTCGKVAYISIPTHEGVARGFAFIEYETDDQAKEAVKQLNTIGNPTHSPAAPKGMRVMSKDTWYRLKDEFRELQDRLARAQKAQFAAPEAGVVMFIGNVGPDLTSKDIKLALKKLAPVAYVEYNPTTRTGYVRFKMPSGAQTAVKHIVANKYELAGKQITCRILSGLEESDYWAKIHTEAAQKKLEAHKDASESTHQQNKYKRYDNNNSNTTNTTSTDNTNNNNDNNSKKHPLPSTQEPDGEDSKSKKQRRQNKEVKLKGKKIPSISKAKPKSHVFFNEEGELEQQQQQAKANSQQVNQGNANATSTTVTTTNTTTTSTTTENNSEETRKRTTMENAEESSADTKRPKLES